MVVVYTFCDPWSIVVAVTMYVLWTGRLRFLCGLFHRLVRSHTGTVLDRGLTSIRGHITTAKPALMHGVYGSKTIMIRENDTGFWYTVLRARYNALT